MRSRTAREFIFAENQYFTSTIVAAALAAPLARAGSTRGRPLDAVDGKRMAGIVDDGRAAGARCIAGCATPTRRTLSHVLPDASLRRDGDAPCINVHSKVLIVDDEFLTLGSANLSNRSMCLDTECNLAIEARGDPRIRQAIAGLRARLLGEHLGVDPGAIRRASKGSLHETIASLHDPRRRHLQPIEPAVDPTVDAIVPDHEILDPDGPFDPEVLIADLLPAPASRERVRGRILVATSAALAIGALALAWRYTGLAEAVTIDNLRALGEQAQSAPWAPLLAVAAFVAAGLALVPVTLMIGLTAALFGPFLAIPISLAGALASGAVTFGLGRVLERRVVREIAGERLTALSSRLRRRGLVAVLLVRVLPVAPYSVVNIVAGASRIRWRDFLLGTALGLMPGLVLTSAFVDRAIAAVVEPSPRTFATLALVLAAIAAIGCGVRRRFASAPH